MTTIKSKGFTTLKIAAARATAAVPTVKLSVSKVNLSNVDSIMAPYTQPANDLDALIERKEAEIDAGYMEIERLRALITATQDRMQAAQNEIAKAYQAKEKIAAIFA